jgi:hypothetical protein
MSRAPLFGPLPTRGPWTAVGLERGQFLAILAASVALFVWIGGPLWMHLRSSHLDRIGWSYAAIPPLVATALVRNGRFGWLRMLEASALIALVKLVLTAVVLVGFAIAR